MWSNTSGNAVGAGHAEHVPCLIIEVANNKNPRVGPMT
jgi:hypothetical protein